MKLVGPKRLRWYNNLMKMRDNTWPKQIMVLMFCIKIHVIYVIDHKEILTGTSSFSYNLAETGVYFIGIGNWNKKELH